MCALAEKTADPTRKVTKKDKKDAKKKDATELNPLAIIKTLLAKQEAMAKELAKVCCAVCCAVCCMCM